MRFVVLLVSLVTLFSTSVLQAGPCKNVLIYYTSWSKYNSPAYNYTSIPYSKITHIAYAFIEPNADASLSITGDYMGSDGVHYDGVSMIAAAHAQGVKVLLSCGGAGSGVSANYTTISASSTLINTFANNLKNYCVANGFDGVDLDWEYPNTATTSNQFNNLLSGIRAVMPSPQWLLTAALSADSYSPTFLHISTINNYLSYFNLMCYDYHGSWLTHSGDNAPLLEDSQDPGFGHTASGVTAVNYYVSNGAAASKIMYGLPFYGYGFNTAGLYQNCGGNCTTTTLTYAQIAPLVGVNWTRNWDGSSDSPNITYNAGASVISYDDAQSVTMKANYVLNTLGVAGIFAWSADQDYNGSTQPLLDAMYQSASAGCAPTNTPTVTSTATNSPTITNTPTAVVASLWRVNAGGPQYTDTLGNVWSADENFSGGTGAIAAGSVTGTTDPTLYAGQRYGNNFTYTFNVPPGSYQVTLKFAETYSGDYVTGARVFNVAINGTTVLPNFDVYAAAGAGNKAVDKVFDNISPSGGTITIHFTGTSSTDPNALVEALQICPEPASPTATSTATILNTHTSTATSTVTRTATSISSPTASSTNAFTSTSTSTTTSVVTLMQTATSTMTPSATFVKTATPSMTNTPLVTVMMTNTSTTTPSVTPLKTATATSTATSSVTFVKTSTSTRTSTVFFGATSTATSTNTLVSTPTARATSTMTPTLVNTATVTFSSTASPTLTSSSTATLTSTSTRFWTATNTSTPTWTLTPTATRTPTVTYTFTPKPEGPVFYPNPVIGPGPVYFKAPIPTAGDIKVSVYTLAFRKVYEQTFKDPAGGTVLALFLVDRSGMPLANGLYYFHVSAGTQKWVLKVLVLR